MDGAVASMIYRPGLDRVVASMSYKPGGDVIAVASTIASRSMIYSICARTGAKILSPIGLDSTIWCVAHNGTGDTLAAGYDNSKMSLRDTATCRVRESPLEGHENSIAGLFFNPSNSNQLVSGCSKKIRVWDVTSGSGP